MKFVLNSFFQALAAVSIITGGTYILFGPGPNSVDMSSMHQSPMIQISLNQKIYVAVEGEGKIAIINPITLKVVKDIDLSGFTPHNVQVSPDNKTVWVTGNAMAHSHSTGLVESIYAEEDKADEVIVINPTTDKVTEMIPVGPGLHLAHLVLTPDSKYVYVTAQTEGIIYKIDAISFKIIKSIKVGNNSQPHGSRISPDGSHVYIAMLGNKSLGIIDIETDMFSEIPLEGAAVQVGVTRNNKYVVASLYDTKQLAVYNMSDKQVSKINLPEYSRGPIQMYATPDSKYIYLADQGYYFGQPSGELVYKIDIELKKVVKEIKAGLAPHGVVVSEDGKFVYVTNLLSEDVSVIDIATDKEVGRVKVGKEPNGISIWYRN